MGLIFRSSAAFLVALLTLSCSKARTATEAASNDERKDYHSFGNPEQIRITHVDLDLDVRFDQRVLSGTLS